MGKTVLPLYGAIVIKNAMDLFVGGLASQGYTFNVLGGIILSGLPRVYANVATVEHYRNLLRHKIKGPATDAVGPTL